MLMIRLQRIGRTNDAAFRVALLEKARAARAGRIVRELGSYNPKTKAFAVNEAEIKEWIAKGAQPTDTMKNLLIKQGILTGKKADALPASARKKAREAAAKAVAEAAAAKAAEEAAAKKAAEDAAAEAAAAETVSAEASSEEASASAEESAAEASAE